MQALVDRNLLVKKEANLWVIDIDGLCKSGTPDRTKPDLLVRDRVEHYSRRFMAAEMPPLMYDFLKTSLDKLDSKKTYKTSGGCKFNSFNNMSFSVCLCRPEPNFYHSKHTIGMNSFDVDDFGLQLVLSGRLSSIYDLVYFWRRNQCPHYIDVAELRPNHCVQSLPSNELAPLEYVYTSCGRLFNGAGEPLIPRETVQ